MEVGYKDVIVRTLGFCKSAPHPTYLSKSTSFWFVVSFLPRSLSVLRSSLWRGDKILSQPEVWLSSGATKVRKRTDSSQLKTPLRQSKPEERRGLPQEMPSSGHVSRKAGPHSQFWHSESHVGINQNHHYKSIPGHLSTFTPRGASEIGIRCLGISEKNQKLPL